MDLQLAPDQRDRVEEFRRKHRIGLLTLLFTDMVGSTRLKQALGDKDGFDRIQQHHALVRQLLAAFPEGEEIGTSGDSFFLVFAKPSDAVKFSLLLQSRLRDLTANPDAPLQDRIGIHIGEVIIEERPGTSKPKDLYGIQVDICARVMSLGQGDQILMTRASFDNARQVLRGPELAEAELGPLTWTSHGPYLLQGVDEPLEVCEVGETGRAHLTPPADSSKARRAETQTSPLTKPNPTPPNTTAEKENPTQTQQRQPIRRWVIPLQITIVILGILIPMGVRNGWFHPKSPATELLRCTFETTEGYQAGQPVSGHGGWQRGAWKTQLPAGGEGIATGLLDGSSQQDGSPQQAFLGSVPGQTTPGVHASLRRTVTFTPASNSNSQATVDLHWRQQIKDSTDGIRNRFEWLFYNQSQQLLGGLLFDNATTHIMSRRPDNTLADTGLTFERGRTYPIQLHLDFHAKTWTATIDKASLGPFPLSPSDRDQPMNLGAISMTWWSVPENATTPNAPLTGNNLMAFDDLVITAPK
ncbi:adenylate/guanylate cyclase domain-containing protein [Luteolibacter soli]|uniref:Adenylate/guanylate cyclase domain-containing protein n=1 Tax=Luteolibacter soli TaxID=3135280 RepID=A0ABU9AW17_9BACT